MSVNHLVQKICQGANVDREVIRRLTTNEQKNLYNELLIQSRFTNIYNVNNCYKYLVFLQSKLQVACDCINHKNYIILQHMIQKDYKVEPYVINYIIIHMVEYDMKDKSMIKLILKNYCNTRCIISHEIGFGFYTNIKMTAFSRTLQYVNKKYIKYTKVAITRGYLAKIPADILTNTIPYLNL